MTYRALQTPSAAACWWGEVTRTTVDAALPRHSTYPLVQTDYLPTRITVVPMADTVNSRSGALERHQSCLNRISRCSLASLCTRAASLSGDSDEHEQTRALRAQAPRGKRACTGNASVAADTAIPQEAGRAGRGGAV